MSDRRHRTERAIRRHAELARVVYRWIPEQLGRFAKMKPGDCSCGSCRAQAAMLKHKKRDRRWKESE